MRTWLSASALPALGLVCVLTAGCSDSATDGEVAMLDEGLHAAPFWTSTMQGYVGVKRSTSPLESQIRFMHAEQDTQGNWSLKEDTSKLISLAGAEVVDFLVEDLDDDKDLDDIAAVMRLKNNSDSMLRLYWAGNKNDSLDLALPDGATPISVRIALLNDDSFADLIVLSFNESTEVSTVSIFKAEEITVDGVDIVTFNPTNRDDYALTGFHASTMHVGAHGKNIVVRHANTAKFPAIIRNKGIDASGQWLGLHLVD